MTPRSLAGEMTSPKVTLIPGLSDDKECPSHTRPMAQTATEWWLPPGTAKSFGPPETPPCCELVLQEDPVPLEPWYLSRAQSVYLDKASGSSANPTRQVLCSNFWGREM